jgi:cell division protein FtsW
LPFLSWGGTAMVFTGLSVGIILSVSRGEQDEAWEKGVMDIKEGREGAEAKAA